MPTHKTEEPLFYEPKKSEVEREIENDEYRGTEVSINGDYFEDAADAVLGTPSLPKGTGIPADEYYEMKAAEQKDD